MSGSSRRMLIAITFGIIAPLAFTVTRASACDSAGVVKRLRSLELARLEALVAGDIATVERLLAEDFVLVPPPGTPLSKSEYVGALRAGAIDYHDFRPVSPIEVRLYGPAAVLTYRSYIDVVVAGLGAFQQEVWHTYVYELRNGRWKAVREQATGVGGFPPR